MYKENNPISYLGIYKIQTHWPQKKNNGSRLSQKKPKTQFSKFEFPYARENTDSAEAVAPATRVPLAYADSWLNRNAIQNIKQRCNYTVSFEFFANDLYCRPPATVSCWWIRSHKIAGEICVGLALLGMISGDFSITSRYLPTYFSC